MGKIVHTAPAAPAVGQVWQAWDVRSRPAGGGHVRIISLAEHRVKCERVRQEDNVWVAYSKTPVSLLISRLRPTSSGYRLVYDPQVETAMSSEAAVAP